MQLFILKKKLLTYNKFHLGRGLLKSPDIPVVF